MGVGPSIPVDVLVSDSWPDLCAQLAKVEQGVSGQWIEISLLASAADPNCSLDRLGLPFLLAVPLKLVELQTGQYTVVVNLLETSFEWTGASAEHGDGDEPIGSYDRSPDSSQKANNGLTYAATGDEHIFLRGLLESERRQISPDLSGGFTIYPVFSPQGDQIDYLADLDGLETPMYNLYVPDLETGEACDQSRFEAAWELQWTADGQHLVFSAGLYDARQVLQVSLADGMASVLAQGESPVVAGN